MSTIKTLLIIPCYHKGYLGRLIRQSVKELCHKEEVSCFIPGDGEDSEQLINIIFEVDRSIAVECGEGLCIGAELRKKGCKAEFVLQLPDLGIEDQESSELFQEDVELLKDGIIACSTRTAHQVPVFPGCGCR